jgi:DNA-nicking Smr family endonuclease
MKRSAPPGGRIKSLADLKSVRIATSEPARAAAAPVSPRPTKAAVPAQTRHQASAEFLAAVRDVTPLAKSRPVPVQAPVEPEPLQRVRDDQAALDESLTEEIGIESLLETDESLSYRRDGISAETLRKLRRGFWVVQGELDLHGHRVEEARYALGEFLRNAMHRGRRCVRIVHGKGLGSRDGVPILKGKVRTWLIRREEVIAFCQARPTEGGAGALIVLLKPSSIAG